MWCDLPTNIIEFFQVPGYLTEKRVEYALDTVGIVETPKMLNGDLGHYQVHFGTNLNLFLASGTRVYNRSEYPRASISKNILRMHSELIKMGLYASAR